VEKTIARLIFFILIAAAVLTAQGLEAADKEDPQRAEILRKVRVLLKDGDTFEAIEFLNSLGKPETVAERYSDLVRDLYWKERAVPELVTIARAGIQYCLTKAQEIEAEDAELAKELRSAAKTNAYNLASFTWPGWDHEGIVINQAELAAGLDAAKVNLRLARELEKGPLRVSMAYWVLGAQYMAAGKHSEALEAFVLSKEQAHASLDSLYELLASGYVGVAKIAGVTNRAEGERELEEAIESLKKFRTDDAQFCIDQLRTAVKVFGGDTE